MEGEGLGGRGANTVSKFCWVVHMASGVDLVNCVIGLWKVFFLAHDNHIIRVLHTSYMAQSSQHDATT